MGEKVMTNGSYVFEVGGRERRVSRGHRSQAETLSTTSNGNRSEEPPMMER